MFTLTVILADHTTITHRDVATFDWYGGVLSIRRCYPRPPWLGLVPRSQVRTDHLYASGEWIRVDRGERA